MARKGVILDWIGTVYQRDQGPFLHSQRVLKELKRRGYRLGLVSLAAAGIDRRTAEVETSNLKPYFDCIIIEGEKGPEQYLRCMEALETSPDTTAIVDDRTDRGIQVGNQLGCTTVWIQKGEYESKLPTLETGEPTHRIDSIDQLLDILP